MSYSLEDFSNECKIALTKNSGAEGTELVRQAVEKAKKKQDDWVMVEHASAIDMIKDAMKRKGGKRKTRKHKKKHRRKTKRKTKRRVKKRRKTRRR